MRLRVLMIAGLVLLLPAVALATGTIQIRQADNTVQTYHGAVMKVTLTVRSADGVSTMVIGGINCAQSGALLHCRDGGFSVEQGGQWQDIPIKTGSFYFNLTDRAQASPLSTIPPRGVRFEVETAKGTHIVGDGKLD